MTCSTLDQLEIGAVATVTRLTGAGANRRRLMDLGILPGTQLLAELKSPLGDPVAYRVREALIALRRKQAREIEITLVNDYARE
jgi:ferrous iron transport protein A